MIEEVDIKSLSESVHKSLISICDDRVTKAVLNDELSYITDAVDLAINQKTDLSFFTGGTDFNTSDDEVDGLSEQYRDDYDEYSALKVPLLSGIHRVLTTHIKAASFPADADNVKIERDNDKTFNELGIKDFLPVNNQEWEKILKIEDERFQYEQKYAANIAEVCAYGITGGLHFYNENEHFVDLKAPGIRNIGVWPLTDRWWEATLIVKYDMPYGEFKNRFDFDEEARKVIRPEDGSYSGSSRDARTSIAGSLTLARTVDIPADSVRLYDIYVPALYVTDESGEEKFYEKLFLTVAFGPNVKDSNKNDFILKMCTGVTPTDHGIVIARYGTTLPGQLYHQGPLIPHLSDQLQLNQMKSGISRIAALLSDPPLSAINAGADYQQTPPTRLESGAIYSGWELKSIVPDSYPNAIQQFQAYYSYLSQEVMQDLGLNPNIMGSPLRSRRTAKEVEQYNNGTASALNDAQLCFDREYLKRSRVIRVQKTQNYLVESTELEVEMALQGNPVASLEEVYNAILPNNPLYQRLKIFSSIEFDYKDFYEKNQKDVDREKSLYDQIQQIMQQKQQIQEQLAAPIPPYQGSPQPMAVGYMAVTPTDQREQYIQRMTAQKQAMATQLPMLDQRFAMLKSQLTGVEPAPPPSDYLFYEILAAKIADSNIVITGSMSGIQKETAMQSLAMIMEAARNLPQFAAKVDFDKVADLITKGNGYALSSIKKSEADLAKDEEMMAMQQQQMMQMQQQQQPPQQ